MISVRLGVYAIGKALTLEGKYPSSEQSNTDSHLGFSWIVLRTNSG